MIPAQEAEHTAKVSDFAEFFLQRFVEFLGHELSFQSPNEVWGWSCPTKADSRIPPRTRIPSEPPVRSLVARSGWGMIPTTLRRRLQTAAMLATEPFGLAISLNSPSDVQYLATTCPSRSSAARLCFPIW